MVSILRIAEIPMNKSQLCFMRMWLKKHKILFETEAFVKDEVTYKFSFGFFSIRADQ